MILNEDCLEGMRALPDAMFDSIVTDPPYHLTSIVKRFGGENSAPAQHGTDGAFARASRGFMGQQWDGGDIAFRVELWRECLRVLKPGGHVLAFSGSRTYHRMACAIEDAGFEIRDQLMWLYGSGFPKSHDVSKGIDKAAGAEREILRTEKNFGVSKAAEGKNAFGDYAGSWSVTAAATDEARQWEGWGTALKPAHEPICLARKPLVGSVAANVLEYGTGALNIDGCRVAGGESEDLGRNNNARTGGTSYVVQKHTMRIDNSAGKGRWPANVMHDSSDEVVELFPVTGASKTRTGKRTGKRTGILGAFAGQDDVQMGHDDNGGSAARFFYCAKASKADRGEGNTHPTVKPNALMRYLCRLVTPPGGLILDPFAGSGSTGVAALQEGFAFVGFEQSAEYAEIATRRIGGAL